MRVPPHWYQCPINGLLEGGGGQGWRVGALALLASRALRGAPFALTQGKQDKQKTGVYIWWAAPFGGRRGRYPRQGKMNELSVKDSCFVETLLPVVGLVQGV